MYHQPHSFPFNNLLSVFKEYHKSVFWYNFDILLAQVQKTAVIGIFFLWLISQPDTKIRVPFDCKKSDSYFWDCACVRTF